MVTITVIETTNNDKNKDNVKEKLANDSHTISF